MSIPQKKSLRRLASTIVIETDDSFLDEEVIEHHGILGQKWGVRRFQNKDGSLKPAGKKRYDSGNSEERDKGLGPGANTGKGGGSFAKAAGIGAAGVMIGSSVYAAKQALGKTSKSYKGMSDDDLMKANKRAGLENKYKQNNNIKDSPSDLAGMAKEGVEGVQKYMNAGKQPSNPNLNRYNTRQTLSQKEMDRMSDQDLQKLVNRLNLETQYSRLTSDPPTKSKVEVGLEKTTAVLTIVGSAVGIGAAGMSIYNNFKNRNK